MLSMKLHLRPYPKIILLLMFAFYTHCFAQTDTTKSPAHLYPVVLSSDTLFYIGTNIGPFTPQQRAREIDIKLNEILDGNKAPDSIEVKNLSGLSNIILGSEIIMSVTDQDAALMAKGRSVLADEYAGIIKSTLKKNIEIYSSKNLIFSAIKVVVALLTLIFLLWGMRKIIPKGYDKLEKWEGSVFRPIKFRSEEIISPGAIAAFFIVLLKLIRLAITLAILYFFVVYTFALFPWTKSLNIKPIFGGILLAVMVTAAAFALFTAIGSFLSTIDRKATEWRGTLIKSVKVKNLELLSDVRILEAIKFGIKVFRFIAVIILAYFYFTLLFSLFSFSRTWASTLFGYIIHPLGRVILSFINFLPNLFTILVIIFVTRYVIKFFRFIFIEIERSTVTFVKFPPEWAIPTFKIVRFLIIVFAAIVIFPYLPGSNSPIFRGISIFLGILFSFGSSSAVANMVGGLVLTYMRPFRIGDRVKIADTFGDIIERTLLVTRIRTIKNVDITIPNSMVLGSHIINYSSSAKNKGLILHTTISIGYDAPWRKVHDLLKSAAAVTENVLKEPEPFILQTALSDFYVHYELNVYTDNPNFMAKTYSELHQNIQDKFNEAGVEIMSPHYTGMRDGNKMQIPDDYLPKNYEKPAFRISPFGNLFNKSDDKK